MAETSNSPLSYLVVKGVKYKIQDSRVDEILELLNTESIIDDSVTDTEKTWSSSKINEIINNINSFKIISVDRLPTSDIDTKAIYLLPKQNSETDNTKEEYIRVNDSWEKIGDTTIDLTQYATKTFVATNYYNKDETLTTEEIEARFRNLQDKDTTYLGSDTIAISPVDNSISVIYGKVAEGIRQYNNYTAADNTITIDNTNRTIKVNKENLGIETFEQQQSDWNESNNNKVTFIKNKPATSYTKVQGSPIVINESSRTIGLDMDTLQELIDQRVISKTTTIGNRIKVIDSIAIRNDLRNIEEDISEDCIIVLKDLMEGITVKYMLDNTLRTLYPSTEFEMMFRHIGNNEYIPLFPIMTIN